MKYKFVEAAREFAVKVYEGRVSVDMPPTVELVSKEQFDELVSKVEKLTKELDDLKASITSKTQQNTFEDEIEDWYDASTITNPTTVVNPCPKCGSSSVDIECEDRIQLNNYVVCLDCYYRGETAFGSDKQLVMDGAVKLWNEEVK